MGSSKFHLQINAKHQVGISKKKEKVDLYQSEKDDTSISSSGYFCLTRGHLSNIKVREGNTTEGECRGWVYPWIRESRFNLGADTRHRYLNNA